MTDVTFKSPVAVPHKYRNRFLRDAGGTTVISGGSSSSGGGGGSSIDLTPYLKKTEAESLYLGINANAASATKFNSARAIKLTGNVTGSVSSDGESGWSIATTIANSAVTNDMLAGSIANSKLANNSVTLWGTKVALGGTRSGDMTDVGSIEVKSGTHSIGSGDAAYTYVYTKAICAPNDSELDLSANNGDNHIHIDTDGNIGIGKAAPEFKLDVDGVGNFVEGIMFNGLVKIAYDSTTHCLMITGPSGVPVNIVTTGDLIGLNQ